MLQFPNRITIHCTVTPNGRYVDIDVIRRWHKMRGWKDIGYHLLIQPTGEIQRGRSLTSRGAHVAGHNYRNAGIALVGTDKFTPDAFRALDTQIQSLTRLYDISPHEIFCHYELDKKGKSCPNMRIANLLSWLYLFDESAIADYLLL